MCFSCMEFRFLEGMTETQIQENHCSLATVFWYFHYNQHCSCINRKRAREGEQAVSLQKVIMKVFVGERCLLPLLSDV